MQAFVLFSFVFFYLQGIVEHYAGVVAELIVLALTGGAVIAAMGALFRFRTIDIPAKYVLFFGAFLMLVAVGWGINSQSSGAIVGGLKFYIIASIFMLLPLFYRFSDTEISQQLKLLLILGVAQLPATVFQRFYLYSSISSGDVITGTVGGSRQLSVLLTFQLAILVAFYVKNWMRRPAFLMLAAGLFLPTTLNETKAMIVFLPLAFLLPYIFAGEFQKNKVRFLYAMSGVGIAFTVFVVVFQYTMVDMQDRQGLDLARFLEPSHWAETLAPSQMSDGDASRSGKFDRLIAPIERFSDDPFRLLVGYGLGNTVGTPIKMLSGDHVQDTRELVGGVFSKTIWETGLLGLGFLLIFMFMIYRDSSVLIGRGGLVGTFAIGWKAVSILALISFAYANLLLIQASSALFAYFLGYIISQRARFGSTIADQRIGLSPQNMVVDHGHRRQAPRMPGGVKGSR